MAMRFDNPYLDESKWADQFLFRRVIRSVTYCSRLAVKKVFCIIEDYNKYLIFINIIWR